MAVGLQVYKADGSLDLDLTKRIPKFIGVKTVTGTGQLLISEVADNPNNKLWYIISSYTPSEDKGSIPLIRISDVKFNGQTFRALRFVMGCINEIF